MQSRSYNLWAKIWDFLIKSCSNVLFSLVYLIPLSSIKDHHIGSSVSNSPTHLFFLSCNILIAMALTRIFVIASLLLFSLLTVATASDYGYGTNPESDKPKSQGYASQSYSEKLKSELKGYSSKVEWLRLQTIRWEVQVWREGLWF